MEPIQRISEDQQTVIKNGVEHHRFLVTENFIYFAGEEEDEVIMYNRYSGILISDNYMAQNSLFCQLLRGEYSWASERARYCMDEARLQATRVIPCRDLPDFIYWQLHSINRKLVDEPLAVIELDNTTFEVRTSKAFAIVQKRTEPEIWEYLYR